MDGIFKWSDSQNYVEYEGSDGYEWRFHGPTTHSISALSLHAIRGVLDNLIYSDASEKDFTLPSALFFDEEQRRND